MRCWIADAGRRRQVRMQPLEARPSSQTEPDIQLIAEGMARMIHYSCDLCGSRLEDNDQRYVVKIEVYAAADENEALSSDDDYDFDLDSLSDHLADADADEMEDATYRGFRFDLCRRCHRRYLNDPLFRAVKKRMGFSEN